MISHGRVLTNDIENKLYEIRERFFNPSDVLHTCTSASIVVAGKVVIVTTDHVRHMPHTLPIFPDFCYVGGAEQVKVFEAIAQERKYQDDKWGADNPQSLPGFLLILESELNEAKLGWTKNLQGKSAPLNEIVQIAAVAVACLERYGLTGSTLSTNDIPDNADERR